MGDASRMRFRCTPDATTDATETRRDAFLIQIPRHVDAEEDRRRKMDLLYGESPLAFPTDERAKAVLKLNERQGRRR